MTTLCLLITDVIRESCPAIILLIICPLYPEFMILKS